MTRRLILAIVLLAGLSAKPLRAAEPCRYYVLLFGGQAEKYRPRTAHTWATFVKAGPQNAGPVALEAFTISWLPVQLPVVPLKLIPEPGRNYGLTETLDLFNTGKQDVSMWGPFEIREDWYAGALKHKQFLDTSVQFLTLDRGPMVPYGRVRHPEISHCVHAIIRTNEALRDSCCPVLWYGEFITRKVAAQMNRNGLLVEPRRTHDWLLAPLGVDGHPVIRRAIDEPILKFLR